MSFRMWLSVATLVGVVVIIYFSRHELVRAWELLAAVNIWILLLLIPGQIFSYYANGEMLFSYLRTKQSIKHVPALALARMSLEMNFVNHILPSGGISGISYMGWRLGHYGVSQSRAAMAQAVRFSTGFVSFVVMLLLSVLIVTIDGNVNRWVILISAALSGLMIGAIVILAYLLSSRARITRFAYKFETMINAAVRRLSFGRLQWRVKRVVVEEFLGELHTDYREILRDKRILITPTIWGVLFTVAEVFLFWITFVALGFYVNPAAILIAYGVASSAGLFVVTPGGVGAYETLMVAFLAIAGLSQGTVIAGVLLTRVVLLLGTIILGYFFYQHALVKYGKN